MSTFAVTVPSRFGFISESASEGTAELAEGAAVLHDEEDACERACPLPAIPVITGESKFRSTRPTKTGPRTRAEAGSNIMAEPPSDLVSTEEIDGDSDPLVKPGTVGGEDEGIRVARMITSLCFLRMWVWFIAGCGAPDMKAMRRKFDLGLSCKVRKTQNSRKRYFCSSRRQELSLRTR